MDPLGKILKNHNDPVLKPLRPTTQHVSKNRDVATEYDFGTQVSKQTSHQVLNTYLSKLAMHPN